MRRIPGPSSLTLTVFVTIWLLTNSGCSRTQERVTTLPGQDMALSAGQTPPAPIETLIDIETFTAFCDRA